MSKLRDFKEVISTGLGYGNRGKFCGGQMTSASQEEVSTKHFVIEFTSTSVLIKDVYAYTTCMSL